MSVTSPSRQQTKNHAFGVVAARQTSVRRASTDATHDMQAIEEMFAVEDSFGDDQWTHEEDVFGSLDTSELEKLTKKPSVTSPVPKTDVLDSEPSVVPSVTAPDVAPVQNMALERTSSKITGANTSFDTSPAWHRNETWLNVAEPGNSSPVVAKKARTPVLVPSSPVESSPRGTPARPFVIQETDECVKPVSRLASHARPSDLARSLLQSKRGISSTAQISARTRNSTIELMTQKPHFNFDVEDSPEIVLSTKLSKNVKPVILSEEQMKVVDIAKQGHSLFYTGSAGTGKSILLKSLIRTLRKQYSFDTVGVAASTGLAACNIGGSTLHSLTGIGLGNGDLRSLIKKIRRSKKNAKRWKTMRALIIDEISMIDGELLDKLNEIGKQLRNSSKPFGGIQLIACGDFYQLPPVGVEREMKFAFESDAWREAIKMTIVLQKVFRQQGDTKFIDMLNDIRRGIISEDTNLEFRFLSRPLPTDDDIEATELFPRRHEVDYANSTKLNKIAQPLVRFKALDTGSIDDEQILQKLLNNFLAAPVLHLKKGAQVMMIKNIDETLVNGSLGKVLDFVDPETYMFYQNARDVDEADIAKKLKSVEKEADSAGGEPAVSKKLESKYLSQDPRSEGLDESVFDFFRDVDSSDPAMVAEIERKKQLIDQLHSASKGKRLPLVRFVLTDGNTRDVLVEPETFQVEDPQNEHRPLASRQQVPLILAWALSIHKSQGQTLTKVKVDLRKTFEKGQAYVALSRATSREGLQVLNFRPDKIMTHQKVIEFYRQLVSVDEAVSGAGQDQGQDQVADGDFEEQDGRRSAKRARHATGYGGHFDLLEEEFSSD